MHRTPTIVQNHRKGGGGGFAVNGSFGDSGGWLSESPPCSPFFARSQTGVVRRPVKIGTDELRFRRDSGWH